MQKAAYVLISPAFIRDFTVYKHRVEECSLTPFYPVLKLETALILDTVPLFFQPIHLY